MVSISLVKRNVAAVAATTCSESGLDSHIGYRDSFDDRTPVQRSIDRFIVPPGSACRVLVGDLEFYYEDGQHITGISLYYDVRRAKSANLTMSRPRAGPVWLAFPSAADQDRDVVRYPASIDVWQDRENNTVRVVLGNAGPSDFYELAENLWLGRTAAGDIGEVWFLGVVWA